MRFLLTTIFISLLVSATFTSPAMASSGHGKHDNHGKTTDANHEACLNDALVPHCALAASSAFDPDGHLWVLWTTKNQVLLSQSMDFGLKFQPAIVIHEGEHGVSSSQEGRPLIEITPNGDMYLLYRVSEPGRHAGYVYFSSSLDNAQSFSAPKLLSDETEPTFNAFHAIAVEEDGTITVAWLDKRDRLLAKAAEKPYNGSAIYFAQSTDRGKSFGKNVKIADFTCQCCRTMLRPNGKKGVMLAWRHIFDENIRDHGVVTIQDGAVEGGVKRISLDNWYVEGCPHHGPTLVTDQRDRIHTAWFSGGGVRTGLFYAHSDNQGESFSSPMAFGGPAAASHPYLEVAGRLLVLVWKEFDGETTKIKMMSSPDQGYHWTDPVTVASTQSGSGHPILISDDGWLYLSWRTVSEGYRLYKIAAK